MQDDINYHQDREEIEEISVRTKPKKQKKEKRPPKIYRDSSGSDHDTEGEENKNKDSPDNKGAPEQTSDDTEGNIENCATEEDIKSQGQHPAELGEIVEETSITGSKPSSRADGEASSSRSRKSRPRSVPRDDQENNEPPNKNAPKSRPRSQENSKSQLEDKKDDLNRSITESSKENDFLQSKLINSSNQMMQDKSSDISLLQPKHPLKALNEIDEKEINSMSERKDERRGTPHGSGSPIIDMQPSMDLKQFVEKLKSIFPVCINYKRSCNIPQKRTEASNCASICWSKRVC